MPNFTAPPLSPYLRRAPSLTPSDTKYVVNGTIGAHTADDLRQTIIDTCEHGDGIHSTGVKWNVLRLTETARTAFRCAGGHPPSALFRAMRRDAANDVLRLYAPTNESNWIGHDRATCDDYYAGISAP